MNDKHSQEHSGAGNGHQKIERNVGLMAVLIAIAISFGGLAEIELNTPSGLVLGSGGPNTRCLRHLRRRCRPSCNPARRPRVPWA